MKDRCNEYRIEEALLINISEAFSYTKLTLAIVSSIVGIGVVNKFIALYGKPNIGPTSLMTLSILVVVYGGYFYTTYTGYKSIIKNTK